MFNIIIGGLTLSSFVSVLSIMLSENIINRIKFLDRFPKILAILKLRNNINKGIAKVYLIIHLVGWVILRLVYTQKSVVGRFSLNLPLPSDPKQNKQKKNKQTKNKTNKQKTSANLWW